MTETYFNRIIFTLVISQILTSVCLCSPVWQNCTLSTVTHQNISTIACSSVFVLDEDEYVYRYESSVDYFIYYEFFDTSSINICSPDNFKKLSEKYSIDSCSSLFCNTAPKLISNAKSFMNQTYGITNDIILRTSLKEMGILMNYCNYCKRDDFISFHEYIVENNATCFSYETEDNACFDSSYFWMDNTISTPLFQGQSLLKTSKNPYICLCDSKYYGYRCDIFSINIVPVTFRGFPIICFVISMFLIFVTMVFNVIPLAYRNFKKIRQKVKFRFVPLHKAIYDEVFSLNWKVIIFLLIYFLFISLENVLSFAFIDVYIQKVDIGAGFFRALSLLPLITALFVTFVIWVNVLLTSMNRSDTVNTHFGLKIILVIFYLFVIALAVLPFVYTFEKSIVKIFNIVYFSLTVGFMMFFIFVFIIFGTKLYLKLRKANNLSIFQIKFTKFVIVLSLIATIVIIQMIFVIIEYAASTVTFGLFYRATNFGVLDVTMCVLASTMIYQMTPFNEMKEIYCCTCIGQSKTAFKLTDDSFGNTDAIQTAYTLDNDEEDNNSRNSSYYKKNLPRL
ncbi:hypothetical protein ABK040_009893 [Willaertia magna]